VSDKVESDCAPSKNGTSVPASKPTKASDDYVYDIFVHRTSALPEWAQAANVATITGLPLDSDDEYDTDTDSEIGDEADEDSNGEQISLNKTVQTS
jgi:hypothetical protein